MTASSFQNYCEAFLDKQLKLREFKKLSCVPLFLVHLENGTIQIIECFSLCFNVIKLKLFMAKTMVHEKRAINHNSL